MQGIIFQEVLGKRVLALEQLRNGLNLLGVADLLRLNSDLLKPLFVFDESSITHEQLVEKIKFDKVSKDEHGETHSWFLDFLRNCTKANLQNFMVFCTGSKFLPVNQTIKVKYSNSEGFVSSTCLYTLTTPASYESEEEFRNSFNTVLETGKMAFTSV